MTAIFRFGLLTSLAAAPCGVFAEEMPACVYDVMRYRCPALAEDHGAAHVCRLEYDYRASAANAVFNEAIEGLRACLGQTAERPADIGVNHPDTYDLKQFEAGDAVISVSLKDKASLGKTFVFLRIDATQMP